MKQFIQILIINIFILLMVTTGLRAEYVFLKDGSITKCKVENESAASITVRLTDGKQMVLNPKNVIRILYTELYLGKIFVNKTDGTIIEAYMVDEDQTTYTFRKELYKPQEFVLKREEVLFTTRKNPTGLTGIPKAGSIIINWKSPYTPVKNYRIYFKSAEEYKVYGETGSTSFRLKELKGNTLYAVKVTAIDKDGYESLPSNEIKVTTLNTEPEPPTGLRCVRKLEKNDNQMRVQLDWQEGVDPDGRVKAYNVYKKDQKGYSLAGTTNKNSFEVKGLNPDSNYFFVVRTVDDKNVESKNSKAVNSLQLKGYDISLEPFLIMPIGKFKEINKIGSGALINGTKTNLFVYDLDIGLALGFWYFKGAIDVYLSYMVPLLATASYKFEIFKAFSIAPKVALGFSYNRLSYKVEPELYTGYGLDKVKKSKWSIEPVALAGVSLSYVIAEYWFASAGADYGMIYETGGPMSFITVSISAGRRF